MKFVTKTSMLACTALTAVSMLHIGARADSAGDEIALDTITVTTKNHKGTSNNTALTQSGPILAGHEAL